MATTVRPDTTPAQPGAPEHKGTPAIADPVGGETAARLAVKAMTMSRTGSQLAHEIGDFTRLRSRGAPGCGR